MIRKKIVEMAKMKVIRFLRIPQGFFWYIVNLVHLKKEIKKKGGMPIRAYLPFLTDRYGYNSNLDKHYFLQDIYMARKVVECKPSVHYDVGSRVDTFVGHILSSQIAEVVLLDIRPLEIGVPGLRFIQTDATTMHEIQSKSIDSLSSLHAVEHFGLGRYGDSISLDACFEAMKNYQRVLQTGGKLYFSVPIGRKDAIYYNSHRQFKIETIIDCFDELELLEFSRIHSLCISSYSDFSNPKWYDDIEIDDYDCGLFIFRKTEERG